MMLVVLVLMIEVIINIDNLKLIWSSKSKNMYIILNLL